jgi:hypothetical protein
MRLYSPVDLTGNVNMIEKLVFYIQILVHMQLQHSIPLKGENTINPKQKWKILN